MNDTIPEISIILPVYNGEKFLSRAIQSILMQSFQKWELIIVNDCSKDNSLEIADSYSRGDKRIRVISNPENYKLPKSLNAGFQEAKGKYLTWTSDDNYYAPEALRKMAQYLDTNRDVGMVFCDMQLIDEEGNHIRNTAVNSVDDILRSNVVGACFLYRAEVKKTIGDYREDLFLVEDYDYCLRIYENYKVGHLEEVLYSYCRNSKSLTSTRSAQIKKMTVALKCEHLAKIGRKMKKRDLRKLFYQAFDSKCMLKDEIKNIFLQLDPTFVFYRIPTVYYVGCMGYFRIMDCVRGKKKNRGGVFYEKTGGISK